MHEQIDYFLRLLSGFIYTLTGGLFINNWMDLLDHHAGAFGVIIAAFTALINFLFQLINRCKKQS
ncbi:hypothetical protein [Methylobacter sp. S3L5C]|uniref:hypothetical protein n=1 Tax=Methylobacter sp. S3L5C TaxID=2839024 RepID=UPI001FAD0528|nr:hypothetical protein [Methylobacter sp. S3L5C]UOA08611.1 hypothetical protein KKZ03_20875 [Methylobacter sp. S3L5C]